MIIPENARCTNNTENNYFSIIFAEANEEFRLHLFEVKGENRLDWCYATLDEYVRDVIGPPFLTNVQEVSGDTWEGYQGVTAMDERSCLVNRVVASRVSDFGARIEFNFARENLPEAILEAVESIEFLKGDQ